MLLLSCCNILASTEERTPNEYLFYDINSSAPFVYNNTIGMRGNINYFNIPFAYDVVVDGNHLEFSISNAKTLNGLSYGNWKPTIGT